MNNDGEKILGLVGYDFSGIVISIRKETGDIRKPEECAGRRRRSAGENRARDDAELRKKGYRI